MIFFFISVQVIKLLRTYNTVGTVSKVGTYNVQNVPLSQRWARALGDRSHTRRSSSWLACWRRYRPTGLAASHLAPRGSVGHPTPRHIYFIFVKVYVLHTMFSIAGNCVNIGKENPRVSHTEKSAEKYFMKPTIHSQVAKKI
jgi:hypothetical protein